MSAILAWYTITLNWSCRELNARMSNLFGDRAFVGTNPLRTFVDGLVLMLVGFLLAALPVVGLLTLPVTAIYLFASATGRSIRKDLGTLMGQGRMDWRNGRIVDPQPEPEVKEGDSQDGEETQ